METFTYWSDVFAEAKVYATICDALLPKLLSGELRVRDMEGMSDERGIR